MGAGQLFCTESLTVLPSPMIALRSETAEALNSESE